MTFFLQPTIIYTAQVIAISCSRHPIQLKEVHFNMYAMQKWWKKHGNQKALNIHLIASSIAKK